MAEHTWVEIKYTPIEVTLNDSGNLDIHATELALDIANEEALYGCWFCFTPLEHDTFGTPCSGDSARFSRLGHLPAEDRNPEESAEG